jgi:dTDP-4-dehydrorhamnose reductase
MRILILGGTGMLGHKLTQVMAREWETYVSVRGAATEWWSHPAFSGIARDHVLPGVDAYRFESVCRALEISRPDVVMNCIGIVKQKTEGVETSAVIRINALFPHELADWCERNGVRLVHFSTDCVFSGKTGGYSESATPDPVDLYGLTKLLGEINRRGCVTLRTSIIGWELTGVTGLLEWFRSQRGRRIRGYTRAVYTGVCTRVLADVLREVVASWTEMHGVYHLASAPISKHDLLIRLRDTLNWQDIGIAPDDSFTCDRSLAAKRFEMETGWRCPSWEHMVHVLADEEPVYAQWRRSVMKA